jgi:hypothetical protein
MRWRGYTSDVIACPCKEMACSLYNLEYDEKHLSLKVILASCDRDYGNWDSLSLCRGRFNPFCHWSTGISLCVYPFKGCCIQTWWETKVIMETMWRAVWKIFSHERSVVLWPPGPEVWSDSDRATLLRQVNFKITKWCQVIGYVRESDGWYISVLLLVMYTTWPKVCGHLLVEHLIPKSWALIGSWSHLLLL